MEVRKPGGILVVGSANMDLVVFSDRFPRPGETILGDRFEMIPGGKGVNQAVCSARLGAETTFLGRMGRDEFHKSLSATMRRDRIDLTYLKSDPHQKTGTALIMVNSQGENEIVVISGSNMSLSKSDVINAERAVENAAIIVTQLEVPTEAVLAAAELARKHNKIFLLNPAPARELPVELYPLTNFITPNETELSTLTGQPVKNAEDILKGARCLLDWGVQNVIVTLGASGVVWVSKNNQKKYPAKKVKAVDTTAAGDAFNGAFACAMAEGQTIDEAISFAIKVAAVSVTRVGAQSSMPTRSEVEDKQFKYLEDKQ